MEATNRAELSYRATFLVLGAFILMLLLVGVAEFSTQRTILQFNKANQTSKIHAIADLRIEKVDDTEGVALGTVEIQVFPVYDWIPITATKVVSAQFTIQSKSQEGDQFGGPLVVSTDLFELKRSDPNANEVRGTVAFRWNLAYGSTPGSRFPFDQYQLELSTASLVVYSQPGTAIPSGDVSPSGVFWPTGTIYPVESIDLHAFAPNTAASADGWQLSDNNRDQRIITLERPSILKALLVIYTLFAVGYILFLLRVAKVDNLPTLIGLVSLFAARETLTRGVTIFPTIVDYVIFTAFVFAGIATALRLLKVQTTQG